MKLKKVIPIIFIFSIFLIGKNNVKANEKSKIDTKFTPSYVYTSEADGMLDFADNKIGDKYHIPVKNDDFNEEMIIHYEEDGIYWKTATDDKLIYSESNFLKVQWSLVYAPEFDQFIIYMHNMYDWVKNKNFHMLKILDNNYDTFPLYTDLLYFRAPHSDYYRYKIMYSKNSKINVQKSYNQDGFIGYKWYFYFSNRPIYITEGTTDKQYLNFMSSVNKPQLNYKNSFTSNDESGDIGKVSIEFNENDNTISKYNYAQFKLQYGSNDFSEENIPAFTHIKIFGKENVNSAWKEIKIDDFKINDEYMSLEMIDKTYDYVEGSLADSTITFQLNFFKTISSLYSTWKIEFYFDNTKNGYFYVADTLKSSNWSKTKRFLEDYLFYEFPSNYNYAYISSTDEVSKGKIIFPTVKIKEDYVLLNGKYYNLSTKEFGRIIEPKTYQDDNFYSYIDFEFNSSKEILALNRYQGSHSETKPYFNKKNNFDLLEFTFYTFNTFTAPASEYFGKDLYFGNVEIIPSECAYFYAPIGYNVSFSESNGSVSIGTNGGYVDIDTSVTIDDSNSSNYYSNESVFKNWISKTWNNIISPFKLISQFYDIITSLKYNIQTKDDIPGFYIDFSYFGISDEVNVINLTWYLQYRETIFNFIYLTIGSLTVVKCIKELKHIFDRGGS